MRRTLLVGALSIAVFFAGVTAAIYALTEPPPARAPSAAPRVDEAPLEPGTVAPRVADTAAVVPPQPPAAAPPRAAVRAVVPRTLEAAPVPKPRSGSSGPPDGTPVRAGPDGVKVSFRMDPRVTKSLHMGTRWVSPPRYVGTQAGNLFTVQARAQGVSAGRAIRDPMWSSSEPDMVAVTPDRGSEVEIAVLREGRSTLTVSEGRAARTLTVNAVHRAGTWQVDISQAPGAR